ncbi:hypothetical protein [Streptomyces sp. WM6372]|uniref:hypothetical protein n=1 Tax=Streptomyces sp. WM6372 TaxID=1415555 RepID=UPI000A96FEA7|nr:hypothetical protein [Streptomyces sp. WM6372]
MRNVTDAFSNHTVLSPAETERWLLEFAGSTGAPPYEFLPVFLHEATHHWCFTSPVGTAVAVLQMRGCVQALRAIEAPSAEERRERELLAVESMARAQVALELMRPLAEGMALFAEFDLYPTSTARMMTAPLRWGVKFANQGKTEGSRNDDTRLAWVHLGHTRLSDKMRRRKEDLLAQPLSCDSSEGYLAGYLTVKSLWRRFLQEDGEFWTSDRFLLQVYHWFYEDPEFVTMLLDSTPVAPGSLTEMSRYFQARLEYIFSASAASQLRDGYLEAASAVPSNGPWAGAAVRVSENPRDAFQQIWQDAFKGILVDTDSEVVFRTKSQLLTVLYHSMQQGRDLMSIGSLPCSVVADDGLTVMINGRKLLSFPTFGKAAQAHGATDATLCVFLSLRGGRQVNAVEGNSDLLAWSTVPPLENHENANLKHALIGRRVGSNINSIIHENAEKINGLRALSHLWGYLGQTRDRLNAIYQPYALLYVPSDQLETLWGSMELMGFYGLLGRNPDAVSALAIFGLASSSRVLGPSVERSFRDAGICRPEALEYLMSMADRYKVMRITSHYFGTRCSV